MVFDANIVFVWIFRTMVQKRRQSKLQPTYFNFKINQQNQSSWQLYQIKRFDNSQKFRPAITETVPKL